MANRIYYIDILRILAIISVVIMHSPLPAASKSSLTLAGISYLTSFGVGIFYMISGALALSTPISSRRIFAKKKFSRIVIPLLFWSTLSIFVFHPVIGGKETLLSILSIPFCVQGNAAYWFLYPLIALYALTPILQPWIERASKREIEVYLLLWVLVCGSSLMGRILHINTEITGSLYYFSGYTGYFLLGYYLHHYYGLERGRNISKRNWCAVGTLFVGCCVIFPFMVWWRQWPLDIYETFWYLTIPNIIMCITIFLLFARFIPSDIPERSAKPIKVFSDLSFGVYLTHILFIRCILWKMEWITGLPDLIQICIIAMGAIVMSYTSCWIISKVKYLRLIIGL